jgi:hypothetical protein
MGSSLLAKSSPGGALRKVDETKIEAPALPGKGEIGSVSRGMLEEPIERQVPPGSTKVVSSAPSVEPNAVAPTGILPTQPITPGQAGAPGIGLPASTPMRGVNGASPDVGMMQPTIRSQAGAPGKAVSGGGVQGKTATAYLPQETSSVGYQGEAGQQSNPNLINAISGNVSGKTYATEGQPRTSAQTRSGLANIAGILGAQTGTVRSIANAEPIGNAIRSAVSAVAKYNPAAMANQAGTAVANMVKSGGAVGQAAQKVSGWLRSLFGK